MTVEPGMTISVEFHVADCFYKHLTRRKCFLRADLIIPSCTIWTASRKSCSLADPVRNMTTCVDTGGSKLIE